MKQGLLAFTCAYVVKSHAPYAAGSGISEIKCILAGFIIKGFLSFQTMVIKSVTLVRCVFSLPSPFLSSRPPIEEEAESEVGVVV